jgi:uncharacterized protein YegL
MSNLSQSLMDQTPDAFPDLTDGGGHVPAASQRGTRFPIMLLVDTSGSTGYDPQTGGDGPGADIHRINAAIQGIFQNLRYPTSGTDLAAEQENIDVCLISYNSRYRVNVPWTMATQLDPNIAPLKADGGTHTGAALTYALGYIGHRIRYYSANNINYGRPTLLHFTDGQPTDMAPGDATWTAIQAALYRVSPLNDPENRFAVIRHLVAGNGNNPLTTQLPLANGSIGTGLSLLAELSGERTALVLEDHPDLLNELVEFVTTFISGVTNIFGADELDPDAVTDDAIQNLERIHHAA